ncbi:Root meristem growth factor 6 like [Melia azedarach]|uniref:Root meristem growth factor 6 like n=1 Tax=Melia azedarach TaxID=155640 RepID=A0ACC1XN71_MELAZ|nr:Root meristem growth factor 6 like [Melia azedarach]
MSALPFLLFLLCISVHACNARFLSIIVKESTVGKQGHLLIEDVGEPKLHKTPIQLGLGHSALKDLRTQARQEIWKNERKIYINQQDGESNPKQEEYSKASLSATSGNIIVSSPNDSQWLAKPEELQSSRARSLLRSSPNDNDEAVDSKENEVLEDTVVMDYAQPHRKPPIHNEKP